MVNSWKLHTSFSLWNKHVYKGTSGHTKPNSSRGGSRQIYFGQSLTAEYQSFLINHLTLTLNLIITAIFLLNFFLFWCIGTTWLQKGGEKKKKRKQRHTASKMIPPSTPAPVRECFMDQCQLESAGICTTKASCRLKSKGTTSVIRYTSTLKTKN